MTMARKDDSYCCGIRSRLLSNIVIDDVSCCIVIHHVSMSRHVNYNSTLTSMIIIHPYFNIIN